MSKTNPRGARVVAAERYTKLLAHVAILYDWIQKFEPYDKATHLRDHLTDGRWHDDCPYCLERRRVGGNGTPNAGSDVEALLRLAQAAWDFHEAGNDCSSGLIDACHEATPLIQALLNGRRE